MRVGNEFLEQRVDEGGDGALLGEDEEEADQDHQEDDRHQPVLLPVLEERPEVAEDGPLPHQNILSKCFGSPTRAGYGIHMEPEGGRRRLSSSRPTRRRKIPTGVSTKKKTIERKSIVLMRPRRRAKAIHPRLGHVRSADATAARRIRTRPRPPKI